MAAIAPDIVVHATERFLTKRANFLHQEKLRLQEMEYGGRNKQEEHQQNQQQQYQQEQQQNQKKQREPAIFTTHRFPSSKNTRPQKHQRDMSPVHVNGDVPTNNTNSAGLRNRSAAKNSRGYVNDGFVANRQDLPPPPPVIYDPYQYNLNPNPIQSQPQHHQDKSDTISLYSVFYRF